MQIITTSEKQTLALAKKIAGKLKGGEIIGLSGDLGAGKTVFVRGLAQGLGIKSRITSPTFVLMKIYKIKGKTKIKNLVHIDAYRINSYRDITAIGVQEYFYRPDTVVVIEWAEKIKKILPAKTRYINIKHGQENIRKIEC